MTEVDLVFCHLLDPLIRGGNVGSKGASASPAARLSTEDADMVMAQAANPRGGLTLAKELVVNAR